MATNPDSIGNNAMAVAMIAAAGGKADDFIAACAKAPKAKTSVKKEIPMTTAPKASVKPAAKTPIERLYGERVGKKVAVGDMTFLIEEPNSEKTGEPARCFRVVKSKGDRCFDRVIFAHELDREELKYKINRSVKAFDEKVVLHALLRPLAVEAGLAKAAAPKAKPAHKIQKGRDVVVKPVATSLVRMETVVAPGSQPVANFGIERLLTAPAGKKVGVGAYSFVIEEGEHDNGPAGRRYLCAKAPEDFGLGNWVMDTDVRQHTSPKMSDNVKGKLREAKIVLHQLLRDGAIDSGLVQGKYAIRPTETITDQAVCLASIRDGIEGRYLVQHPDYDEDAVVELAFEDGRQGNVLQIILVRNNQDGLADIKAGTRISHKVFMKRHRPEKMPKAIEVFADWLDEVVF